MIINNLVETHCHILPGVDDGAQDIQTSAAMINRLQSQGAGTIILTPHYYSDSISLTDFADRRDAAFNDLKSFLGSDGPKLICAAEVYVSDYLMSNNDLSRLKIGDSNYVLVEHNFASEFTSKTYDRLLNLMYDCNIKPILAHIERYKPLMTNEKLLDDYIDAGCLCQANVSSFAQAPHTIRKRLFKYLESGRIHLLGSDCHNLTTRPPSWQEGIKAITEKSGKKAVDILINNANVLTK